MSSSEEQDAVKMGAASDFEVEHQKAVEEGKRYEVIFDETSTSTEPKKSCIKLKNNKKVDHSMKNTTGQLMPIPKSVGDANGEVFLGRYFISDDELTRKVSSFLLNYLKIAG